MANVDTPARSATATPIHGGATKARKKTERLPRTQVEVTLGQCNAALKKVDEATRRRVVKTLATMHVDTSA